MAAKQDLFALPRLRLCPPCRCGEWFPNLRKDGAARARRLKRGSFTETGPRELRLVEDYFLRWRIFARMRRFLRPCFRRPFPDFLVPKTDSEFRES
jgi:hypothetical protein